MIFLLYFYLHLVNNRFDNNSTADRAHKDKRQWSSKRIREQRQESRKWCKQKIFTAWNSLSLRYYNLTLSDAPTSTIWYRIISCSMGFRWEPGLDAYSWWRFLIPSLWRYTLSHSRRVGCAKQLGCILEQKSLFFNEWLCQCWKLAACIEQGGVCAF